MISRRLVRQIERNANKLAEDLVQAVRGDRRAASYAAVSDEQFQGVVRDLYGNLGQWLQSHTWSKLQTIYEKKGRERYHGRIPLAELVYALTRTKSMLLEFVRGSLDGDASERGLELELVFSISEFFDKAIYHTIAGYEDARRAVYESGEKPVVSRVAASPRPAGRARRHHEEGESELTVSRGGDVGETSG